MRFLCWLGIHRWKIQPVRYYAGVAVDPHRINYITQQHKICSRCLLFGQPVSPLPIVTSKADARKH